MKSKNFLFIFLALAAAIIFSGSAVGSSGREILESMTLEEKVGQLFIIRPEFLSTKISPDILRDYSFVSSWDQALSEDTIEILHKYPVGGFMFLAKNMGSLEQVKKFTSELKAECKISPFMAIDEEGGRIRRLGRKFSADVEQIDSMQKIGNTKNPRNAYKAAGTIGSYIKKYGFNLDFAPVADINTNPKNIVIGDRAFGSKPKPVSKMVSAFLDGLHSQNILGVIKHFPGHGDTAKDTHEEYVSVRKTWEQLLKAELIPFIDNFDKTDMIMTAHITPVNITNDGLPATLSHQLLTDKLRNELGYKGVLITDSMGMGAISNYYTSGEASIMAIEAGNDIILDPYSYVESFNAVLNAVKTGRISEERINESVLRILELKKKI